MIIKVHTYGNVSPSFRNLTKEILENVSKNMHGLPPEYNLHLCKTTEDAIKFQREQTIKLSRMMGYTPSEGYGVRGIGTFYYFKFPETIITEDFIMPRVKYLEQLEGSVAHEAGHTLDDFKNQKLSILVGSNLLDDCTNMMKCEYEAENNAIEAGYHSGLFARKVDIIKEWKKGGHGTSFPIFYKQLSLMAGQAAFMQSDKPPQIQKQALERMWNEFSKSRKAKANRELAQCKELKECPEKFGDESFLDDFVFKKHFDWNISF